MKVLSILLNIILIIFVILEIVKHRMPSDIGEVFLFLLLLGTPLVNLVYVLFLGGESWLTLYFKRKALEEKKKIAELEDK
jgi:hypothetical protein